MKVQLHTALLVTLSCEQKNVFDQRFIHCNEVLAFSVILQHQLLFLFVYKNLCVSNSVSLMLLFDVVCYGALVILLS